MARGGRRLSAILFTDLAGFTAMTQADEAGSLRLLEEQEELLRPLLAVYRGRKIKSLGDGLLVEFPNARDAVECAVALQEAAEERNRHKAGAPPLRIRAGVHLGDVEERDDDIFGDAVNLASRIVPLADAGETCVSAQVFDQVHNKLSVRFERLGLRNLKGVRDPILVYRVSSRGTAAAESSERSPSFRLAVLPFANISPEPKDEYFADGLTEELISVLSRIRGLRVIARTSVSRYKDSAMPVTQIGAELAVGSVVEGSVRKAGDRLRISVQLIDARTEEHRWAETFDRALDDVFAIQSEIAERTASALRIEIGRSGAVEARANPTADPAAYELYLRGLVATGEMSREGYEKAFLCFEDATRRDPGFAEAYAAWANACVLASGEELPMRPMMPRVRELALRALELDPDSSAAHCALANIAFQFDHDWARAETEFRKALEVDPSNVLAHRYYGFMLKALGRFDEAREEYRRATRLDPGGTYAAAPGSSDMISWIDLESGNYEAAIAMAERNVAAHPKSVAAHVSLGLTYLTAGRRSDALRAADAPVTGADEDERFDHALLNALLGRPEEARETIERVESEKTETYTSATHLAMLYAAMGEKKRALDLLESDLREGDPILWLWYRGVYFDSLRDDPRFVALLRAYGLPAVPASPREESSAEPIAG